MDAMNWYNHWQVINVTFFAFAGVRHLQVMQSVVLLVRNTNNGCKNNLEVITCCFHLKTVQLIASIKTIPPPNQ